MGFTLNYIKIVKAFKYDDTLFNNMIEVNQYIKSKQDHKKMLAELAEQEKLETPETFKIKQGYFDFFVFPTDSTYGENYKRVCYKTKNFKDALDKVMNRQDCIRLDYECEILDKNKKATGIFIDLNKMPKNHPVHQYT
jgi:predicted RNA-binding protein Jag